MRAKLVENIEFIRGRDSKHALNLGIANNINTQDLANIVQLIMDIDSNSSDEDVIEYGKSQWKASFNNSEQSKLLYLWNLYLKNDLKWSGSYEIPSEWSKLMDVMEKNSIEGYFYNAGEGGEFIDVISSTVLFSSADQIKDIL